MRQSQSRNAFEIGSILSESGHSEGFHWTCLTAKSNMHLNSCFRDTQLWEGSVLYIRVETELQREVELID